MKLHGKDALCCSEPPELTEFADDHWTRLIHIFHRIRRVNFGSLMELTPGEFYVMQIIGKGSSEDHAAKGIYVSEIAKKARMAASQVSRMLRNLEEQGFVGRSIDLRDRRNTYVFLTEKGETISREQKKRTQDYLARINAKMGHEKMDQLAELLQEMMEVMESEIDNEGNKERRNKDGQNI